MTRMQKKDCFERVIQLEILCCRTLAYNPLEHTYSSNLNKSPWQDQNTTSTGRK